MFLRLKYNNWWWNDIIFCESYTIKIWWIFVKNKYFKFYNETHIRNILAIGRIIII